MKEINNEKYNKLEQIIKRCNPGKRYYRTLTYYGIPGIPDGLEQIQEIEIKIADVMSALDFVSDKYNFYALTTEGKILRCSIKSIVLIICTWDLSNDSLRWHKINRPETVDEIYKLLSKLWKAENY